MLQVSKELLEFLVEHAVATEFVEVRDDNYHVCVLCGGIWQHERECCFAEVIAQAKEVLHAAG